jgi:phosphatidylserine/phosphatidylglycerophosphate/cardiolipin synthase-like enzyme
VIRTATGMDIERLMNGVIGRPDRYAQVVVCSPFIDERMQGVLVRLAQVTRRAGCGLRVITTPTTAGVLVGRLPGHPATWHGVVVARMGLHAKVYLVLARPRGWSEAIVTSANFTAAGVEQNIELGVRVSPSTDSGRQLINEVRHFLQRVGSVGQSTKESHGLTRGYDE